MLQRVAIEGVELPRLYMAENMDDVLVAKSKGIPYIRWNLGMTELLRQLLRPTLEKMFPYIKWNKVIGRKKGFKTKVVQVPGAIVEADAEDLIDESYDNDLAIRKQKEYICDETRLEHSEEDEIEVETADIATSKREFVNGKEQPEFYHQCSIAEYVGDLSSCVNIEVLQNLRLLPKFMGDIVDCIKINLSNSMRWHEGYNKKREVPIGSFGNVETLPNLIILDVSGSIPRGISATMLTLIDTMRTELDADLIITANRSVFYPHGTDLPDPQAMRDYFGYGNECREFYKVLKDEVCGRKWGHVISFGDYDAPAGFNGSSEVFPNMTGTQVMKVHHYHTGYRMNHWDLCNGITKCGNTGYAEWVYEVNPAVEEYHDTSWCEIVEE